MLNECFRCLKQPKNLSYEAVRDEYGMETGYTEDTYGNIDLQRALEKLFVRYLRHPFRYVRNCMPDGNIGHSSPK